MEEGNGVKRQDLEAISRLLVRAKFRIASNPSSEFDMGRGSSPGHVLHPFLLALHTNLAADEAKLGVCRARTQGGTLEPVQAVKQSYVGLASSEQNEASQCQATYITQAWHKAFFWYQVYCCTPARTVNLNSPGNKARQLTSSIAGQGAQADACLSALSLLAAAI